MKVLQQLIPDSDSESFFKTYWTQREYLSQNGKFDEHWFGPDDLADIMSRGQDYLVFPTVRLIKNGKIVPAASYYETYPKHSGELGTRLSLDKISELCRKGATLAFRGLNNYDQRLYEFCRQLAAEFKGETQINAYLTQKGMQGFDPHYDHHEIFIIQVKGEKDWRLYDLYPYPLPAGNYYDQGKPDYSVCREYTLKPGNILYIPRGMWHDASASNMSSLHLTLNIKCKLKTDLLHWLIDELAETSPEMRRNLMKYPFEDDKKAVDGIITVLKSLNFDHSMLGAFRSRYAEKENKKLPFNI